MITENDEDMKEEVQVSRLPHGFFQGGVTMDLCPTITTSMWQHNNFIVEKDNMVVIPKRKFRIRKLTPRECFRLMDVSEEDIDKIQASGVSKTQQYKMAGNSIVVNCLYHIFRTMFVDTEGDNYHGRQLTMF